MSYRQLADYVTSSVSLALQRELNLSYLMALNNKIFVSQCTIDKSYSQDVKEQEVLENKKCNLNFSGYCKCIYLLRKPIGLIFVEKKNIFFAN